MINDEGGNEVLKTDFLWGWSPFIDHAQLIFQLRVPGAVIRFGLVELVNIA